MSGRIDISGADLGRLAKAPTTAILLLSGDASDPPLRSAGDVSGGADEATPSIRRVSAPFLVNGRPAVRVVIRPGPLGRGRAKSELERVFGDGEHARRLEVPAADPSGVVELVSLGRRGARTVECVVAPRAGPRMPDLGHWVDPVMSWIAARETDELKAWVPGVCNADADLEGVRTLLEDCAAPASADVHVLVHGAPWTWNVRFGDGFANVSVWSMELTADDAETAAAEIIRLIETLPGVGYAAMACGTHSVGLQFPRNLFDGPRGVQTPRALVAAAAGWCLVDTLWWQAIRRDGVLASELARFTHPLTDDLVEIRIGDAARWWGVRGGVEPAPDRDSITPDQADIARYSWLGTDWWKGDLGGGWLARPGRLIAGADDGEVLVVLADVALCGIDRSTGRTLWSRPHDMTIEEGSLAVGYGIAWARVGDTVIAVDVGVGGDVVAGSGRPPAAPESRTALEVNGYQLTSSASTVRIRRPDGTLKHVHTPVPGPARRSSSWASPLVRSGDLVCWSWADGRAVAVDFGRDAATIDRVLDEVAFGRWSD